MKIKGRRRMKIRKREQKTGEKQRERNEKEYVLVSSNSCISCLFSGV